MSLRRSMMAATSGPGIDPDIASLLHFDGSNGSTTITDETGKTWVSGSATHAVISTAQSKFGGASLLTTSDAAGFVRCTDAGLTIGTADFTMEGWVYRLSSATSVFWDMRPALTNGVYPALYHDTSGNLHFFVNNADAITGSGGNLPLNTWVHVAVCRSGSSTRLFADGVQTGSTYSDSNDYLFGRMTIGVNGYDPGTATNFNGYNDEWCLTIGVAKYTANFTPPAGPF